MIELNNDIKIFCHKIYDETYNSDLMIQENIFNLFDKANSLDEPYKTVLINIIGKDYNQDVIEKMKYQYQKQKKRQLASELLSSINISDINQLKDNIDTLQSIDRDISDYDPYSDNIDVYLELNKLKESKDNFTSDLGIKIRYNGTNIIGAITGHGKTILSLNLFYELLKKNKNVVFFSLEAPKKAVLQILLQIKTGQKNLDLTKDDLTKDFQEKKNYFIYDNLFQIEPIIKKILGIRRLKETQDLFVFIDYIQLIEAIKDFTPKTYLIEYIFKQLINLANKENITFIIMCQVNREGIKEIKNPKQSKDSKQPDQADQLFNPLKSYHLKDSASIEHAADRLYTIFNKYYYLIEAGKKGHEVENCRGYLNIKSNKVRNEEFIGEHIQLKFDDSKKLKLVPGPENNASGSVNNQEKNKINKQKMGI